jgi:hypothetical protein
MTPPASARPARRSASGSRPAPAARARRISGPSAHPRSGALAAAVAIPAPGVSLPRERKARPLAPQRGRPARKQTRRSPQSSSGMALRAVGILEGVSSSAFVDKLVRGRLWIGMLAFALIGIVAMQLLVLKLNTGIGHTLARVETLQRENAQLDIENSMYSAEGRVAPLAAAAGMTLAPAGTVHFVIASKADVARAAAALSTAGLTPTAGSASTSTAAESSTSSTSSGMEAQTSSGASSQVGSGAEAQGTATQTPAAGTGSSAAGTTETGSSASSPESPPASSASASSGATSSSTPAGSTAGAQTGEAVTKSGAEGAQDTQASGPAGGTQATAGE